MSFKEFIPGIRAKVESRDIPVRLYVHETGIKEVFGPGSNACEEYAEKVFADPHVTQKFGGMDYFIAALWGDMQRTHKVIDLFGYKLDGSWPGNPGVHSWVIRNGVVVPDESISCGDMMIVLGKEEEQRRIYIGLDAYLASLPVPEVPCAERTTSFS